VIRKHKATCYQRDLTGRIAARGHSETELMDKAMQKKTLTVKKVFIIGAMTGISVIIIAFFAIYMQQRRAITASREGTLPRARELAPVHHYTTDHEGAHYYVLEHEPSLSNGHVRAWSRLIYTQDGKTNYILRRRQRNIFVEGFDKVAQRDILYEFECTKNPVEYAVIEVFEVDETGKTLDYGKIGSSKDWEAIPEGTNIDKLAQIVCPSIIK